jgi:hypothetical protein
MILPMKHRLKFFLITHLLAQRSWALEPILKTSDPDSIFESILAQIKADFEDPVGTICAEVEVIIRELDKMTSEGSEAPNITFPDCVCQMTSVDAINHDIDHTGSPDSTSDDV